MNRDTWRALCEQEVGKPYIWGADGPDAYDCSGFAQWALHHLALDPPGDQTAAGLYRHFSSGRSTEVSAAESGLGDLVFFGSDEAVTHVALAWGGGQMLEAGGGGRKTTTVAIARERRAEVRIRPIAQRKDLVAILRPEAIAWTVSGPATRAVMTEAAGGNLGHFVGAPPVAAWLGDGRSMQLKQPFAYVEPNGREWPVPVETVVNGASIPQIFWALIGGPFEGLYRDASIVHDHYCDVRSRTWEDTHRVFYNAMLCSGVGGVRAKTMYYAVYRFGPRWTQGPAPVVESFGTTGRGRSVPTALPVEAFDAASFEADAELIRVENPGVDEIEALAQARSLGQGGDALAGESAAAFSRQPLLQRLVALQDAATDAAASEAVGRLIARHADAKRVIARAAGLEAALSFDQLKAGYEALYASCVIRPQHAGEVAWHRKKLVQYRPRYEAVSTRTGVPWWFIGIVHALEVSFNFNGHLHNGDPLGARTVRVPQGRPAQWKPPTDWESSAVDALTIKNFVAQDDWSVARALHRFEGYNGFGYHGQGIESPYLWSFSNHYTRGKFVADHLFDPNAVSRQCGAAVMMRALQEAGLLEAELT